MSLGLSAAAFVAHNMLKESMSDSTDSSSSYETERLLGEQNALLQCQDLSNVPTITGYISIDTDAGERLPDNCTKCEYSKEFYYVSDEPKLICLKKLLALSFKDSVVDDEHICKLYKRGKSNCCCRCGG